MSFQDRYQDNNLNRQEYGVDSRQNNLSGLKSYGEDESRVEGNLRSRTSRNRPTTSNPTFGQSSGLKFGRKNEQPSRNYREDLNSNQRNRTNEHPFQSQRKSKNQNLSANVEHRAHSDNEVEHPFNTNARVNSYEQSQFNQMHQSFEGSNVHDNQRLRQPRGDYGYDQQQRGQGYEQQHFDRSNQRGGQRDERQRFQQEQGYGQRDRNQGQRQDFNNFNQQQGQNQFGRSEGRRENRQQLDLPRSE